MIVTIGGRGTVPGRWPAAPATPQFVVLARQAVAIRHRVGRVEGWPRVAPAGGALYVILPPPSESTMRNRLALLGLFALACRPAVPAGTLISMSDNQYSGVVTRVPVGTRVMFINHGRSIHNAVAADGAWKTPDVPARTAGEGRGGEVVFDQPGVYRYYCSYHGTKDGGGMAGVIVVGDVDYSPSPKGRIEPVDQPSGRTLRVPAEYSTIQAAVDAAQPGDLVLVDRGVYKEEVSVTTPSIVIRGVDRNATIIDGEFVRGNGISVLADAVAVENLTARNALLNGFFWTGVTGFRGSFLTAINNGDYGIYAFGSSDGLFEDSYASGSPDSGFYIGQCYPCRTIIRNVVAEHNGLGFSGTNAGGALYLVSSVWRHNRAGIVPSSLDVELDPPQREAVYAANLVYSNTNRKAPAILLNAIALGNGILLAGSVRDTVERNVVLDHEGHGIIAAPILDRNYYGPVANVIRNNLVLGSGRADLANGGFGAAGNCFAGNDHRTSAPIALELVQGCRAIRAPWWSDLVSLGTLLVRASAIREDMIPDWKTQPEPPPQPNMPDPLGAPVRIARQVFDSARFDLAAAQLPAETDSVVAAWRAGTLGRDHTPGLAGRVVANASFLMLALVLAWWVVRLFRRAAPTAHPWRRRIGALATGVVLYVLTLGASALWFGRF